MLFRSVGIGSSLSYQRRNTGPEFIFRLQFLPHDIANKELSRQLAIWRRKVVIRSYQFRRFEERMDQRRGITPSDQITRRCLGIYHAKRLGYRCRFDRNGFIVAEQVNVPKVRALKYFLDGSKKSWFGLEHENRLQE